MHFLIPLFLLLSGCSWYKSQGRRDFENDVVKRVPISAVFNCQDTSNGATSRYEVALNSLKVNHPDLIIKESIQNETVVLLASRVGSSTVCVSDGLDFSEYTKNRN